MEQNVATTAPAGNTLKELMAAFSCEGRPVSAAEFQTFWKSCSDDQKAWYKAQPLS